MRLPVSKSHFQLRNPSSKSKSKWNPRPLQVVVVTVTATTTNQLKACQAFLRLSTPTRPNFEFKVFTGKVSPAFPSAELHDLRWRWGDNCLCFSLRGERCACAIFPNFHTTLTRIPIAWCLPIRELPHSKFLDNI